MTWAKLCGSFCFHRKVLEADLMTKQRASGAFARMISWSAENMTSGKLSAAVALTIAKDQKIIDALVDVVMLERDGGHYVIHDFGDYNPTGKTLDAHREQLRAKRSQVGRRGAAARWGHGRQDGDRPSARANDVKPDGRLPSASMANNVKPDGNGDGKPDDRLPSASMANNVKPDGNGDGKPDGKVPSALTANDGKPDGKKMPPSPSPSPSSPPTVVDFALTRTDTTAETGAGRKSNARKAKHTPEQIAAKDRVVQTFIDCFKAKKQVEPKAILEVDHAKAFELAKRFGADESCSIIRRAFEHDFVVRENATIRYIASRADTFRGCVPTKARGPHEQQQVVGDEAWLREHLS